MKRIFAFILVALAMMVAGCNKGATARPSPAPHVMSASAQTSTASS